MNTFNAGDIIIENNNPSLEYVGRWINEANGMISYWQSSYVSFKIKNTSKLKIKAYCDKSNGSAGAWCNIFMDHQPLPTSNDTSFELNTIAFSGERTVTITTPSDNNWHTIRLYLFSEISNQFNSISKIYLTNISIDFGGQISSITLGPKKIQMVGDSWMSTAHDYGRLMNINNYKTYNIAGGGLTCVSMNTMYLYDNSTTLNTSDEIMDAVVISFGVNDFNASISTAIFQTNLLSLVDKVRTKQATAKIFLVRVPSNIGASKDYGQYGVSMSNVAGLRSNVVYLDTLSLDSSIDWRADNGHLGADAKFLMANFLETQLAANGI